MVPPKKGTKGAKRCPKMKTKYVFPIVVAMIAILLLAACGGGGPLTPMAPVSTFTNEQMVAIAQATAQAELIARCNDQAINHANEIQNFGSPTFQTPNVHIEKWAKMQITLVSVSSECGNDYELRILFSDIGTDFFAKYGVNDILNKIKFQVLYKDGTTRDLPVAASNNMVISTIKNFTGFTQIDKIVPVFDIQAGFSTPKMDIVVVPAASGQFVEDVRVEEMSFLDWWVTPTVTPGGYTLDPQTTPLPVYPSPTDLYPFLDFLATDTPGPTPSLTPTASLTPLP